MSQVVVNSLADDAMSKAVSVTEAKAKLSELIAWATENDDTVVIENRGKPAALIVPFSYDEALQALREKMRRQAVLARLETLAARVQAQNTDLSGTEAEVLADEITREALDKLQAAGKLTLGE